MIPRHGNQLLNRKSLTLFAIIVISIFSLLYTPLRSRLTQVLYTFAPSVFHLGSTAGGTGESFFTVFRSKQNLVYENVMLRAENSRMAAQVLDRNLLDERVAKLEEMLKRTRNDNRVVADVIVGFGQTVYDTLVIDAGLDHGIQKGDSVVFAGAGVVGEIIEASNATSKVKLYSSPGEEHLVLLGAHSLPATAHGKGNGNFEAKIPQESAVLVGDTAIVSKGNLILGTVYSVEDKPGLPYKTVLFRSSFNPTEIRTVEVIVNLAEPAVKR